jgi:hypothetical protein
MTEWGATIHAARRLVAPMLVIPVDFEFPPVLEALDWGDFGIVLSLDFDESC